MSHPLVSIIIPTYNRAHLISETLDSVLAQTYTNWECIVVDDGSTDATEALVQSYIQKDLRFQYHKRPDSHLPGGNGARNYGFELSTGEFINWLDSDDVFDSKKLELQLKTLKDNKAQISVCLGEFFNTLSGDFKKYLWSEHYLTEQGVFEALVTQKMRWPSGAVLWHRHVLQNNCWNETLKGGQEWHFHIMQSLKLNDKDFKLINKVLLYIRASNNSITRQGSNTQRFSNYLKARVLFLDYLFLNNKTLFNRYFFNTYNFSLKYVKLLLEENVYSDIKLLSKLIKKMCYLNYLKFSFGLIIYKLFKKDYFLKQVNT
ncbi:glycosyltransferase family 2 protein [Xanthomarina gelatinilytica]|uniref:glycosyltransferase family 2 protein n=1 Tax=Xanthomarina gelatinilytica TaxID=1137281 RepID=UPI003AA7EF8C